MVSCPASATTFAKASVVKEGYGWHSCHSYCFSWLKYQNSTRMLRPDASVRTGRVTHQPYKPAPPSVAEGLPKAMRYSDIICRNLTLGPRSGGAGSPYCRTVRWHSQYFLLSTILFIFNFNNLPSRRNFNPYLFTI